MLFSQFSPCMQFILKVTTACSFDHSVIACTISHSAFACSFLSIITIFVQRIVVINCRACGALSYLSQGAENTNLNRRFFRYWEEPSMAAIYSFVI